MSDEEYVSALRLLNEALINAIDMERKRSNDLKERHNDLEERHKAIKSLLQFPGDYLNPERTKELKRLLSQSCKESVNDK